MRLRATHVLRSGIIALLPLFALAPAASADAPMLNVMNSPSYGALVVDAHGFTLYRLVKESNNHIICTGACTDLWPPAMLPTGATAPTAAPGITGTLGVVTRPEGGQQITINGSPLYTFAQDKKPGEVNGEGFRGVWFAVVADAVPLAATLANPLTLHISATGSTAWGKISGTYRFAGKTQHLACSSARCQFAVPQGATVRLSQTPVNASTWPFKGWTLKAARMGFTRRTLRSSVSFTMNGKYGITAKYVASGGAPGW